MSFVSVVARADFISVMSDGRIRQNRDIIIEEHYQKYRQYENRAFICFTGVLENINNVIDEFEKKYSNFDFMSWVTLIQELYLLNAKHAPEYPSTFALGGRNENNEIEYYYFSCGNSNSEITHRKPTEKNGWYLSLLQSETAAKFDLSEKFKKILGETSGVTVSDYISSQKKLNNYVATIDPSVNTNTKRFIIKKM